VDAVKLISERVLVATAPRVEVLKELRVKELAVLGMAAAGMRVRRDHRIAVRSGFCQG